LCWVSGSWADQLTGLFDDATAQQLIRSSGVADEGLRKHLLDTREAKRETSLFLLITREIVEERVIAHVARAETRTGAFSLLLRYACVSLTSEMLIVTAHTVMPGKLYGCGRPLCQADFST